MNQSGFCFVTSTRVAEVCFREFVQQLRPVYPTASYVSGGNAASATTADHL